MTGWQIMRRKRHALALFGVLALGLVTVGFAHAVNPNEREIKPAVNVQDRDDINSPDSKIWVLNFIFKDPRPITVDIPGRGRKVCWYLVYSVVNKTKEPHTFIPDFELVTQDKDTVHQDQVLPTAQEAIQKLEDPSSFVKLKNSVTMAATPIPPSKENADPTRVSGVAIWDDVNPETNHFYIYVTGLSNGWSVTDAPDAKGDPIVRRKTLRLEFKRLGDPALVDARQIKYEGATWVYRGSKLKVPDLPRQKTPIDDKTTPETGKQAGANNDQQLLLPPPPAPKR
jgi:hypothetical protein